MAAESEMTETELYLRRDRDRVAKQARRYYKTRSSLEAEAAASCPKGKEPPWLSDRGRGVRTLQAEVSFAIDGHEQAEDCARGASNPDREYARCRKSALKRVRRRLPHCVQTLSLIIKNGSDREKSILALTGCDKPDRRTWELARQKYWHDLNAMLRLFNSSRLPRNP